MSPPSDGRGWSRSTYVATLHYIRLHNVPIKRHKDRLRSETVITSDHLIDRTGKSLGPSVFDYTGAFSSLGFPHRGF